MIEASADDLTIFGRPSLSFDSQELRRRLTTMPQDPYFLPGTVRKNLDLDANFTDDNIQVRLTKVGLNIKIHELGGLDTSGS